MRKLSWRRGVVVRVPRAGALAGALTGFLIAFYVFEGAVQFTPAFMLPARNEVARITRQLMPQGWAFFSKDAQSEYIIPYRALADESLVAESLPVGASAAWAFGLDRSGRTQGFEIAEFLQGIDKSQWTPCTTPADCRAIQTTEPLPVHNPLTEPTLCGEFLLVALQPIPWQWRELDTSPEEREAIHVEVSC